MCELLEPRIVLSATISGYKFLDLNCNGIRDTDVVQGDDPDVVFVVDVSSSTAVGPGAIFAGSPVGDYNNDGVENTILDAELSGFAALTGQLLQQGLGNDADVGIILFGGNAVQLDMDGVAVGVQLTIPAGRDQNANNVPDVLELLAQIRHGGQGISVGVNGATTNYQDALQKSIDFFNARGTVPGNGNMVLLTDGQPNDPSSSTAVYADEVVVLQSMGVNLKAYGAGGTSAVPPLQVIDPDAVRFESTDELLAAFGGLQGPKTRFQEPGLAGVKIWLDIDRDAFLDADEPFTFTQSDDPLTQIDETGNYRFSGLPNGTYDVREVIPDGMIQTAPVGGFTTVVAAGNFDYRVYFGNRPGEISGTKWFDENGNGYRDANISGGGIEPGLAGVTIYIDLNDNYYLDPGEPSTVTAVDDALTLQSDETGTYRFTNLVAGTYVVREVVPAGMYPTYPTEGYHIITIGFGATGCARADFGNAPPGTIPGLKWYDADADGVWDEDESTLSGVTIYIDENDNGVRDASERYTTTDRNGRYVFDNLAPGYYSVREELPVNCPWIATSPMYGGYYVYVAGGQTVADVNFGNYLEEFAWVDQDTIYICGIDTDDLIGIYQTENLVSVQVNHFGYQFSTVGINSIIAYGQGGDDVISAQGGYVSVSMYGGWGDDNLTGTWGTQLLEGGDGRDVLAGGSSGDLYIFNGSGDPDEVDVIVEYDRRFDPAFASSLLYLADDVLDFQGSATAVTVNLANPRSLALQGNRRVESAPGPVPDIECVIGSRLDDTLIGNSLANKLEGLEGNDRITGAGGDDELVGGPGNDTYVFDTDLKLGRDSIFEIDGGGIDTIDFGQTTTLPVSVDLALSNKQTVNSGLSLLLGAGANIENVFGGSQNDVLSGNFRANTIRGNGGKDIITGRSGYDALVGGAGDDTYVFDTDLALGTDTVDESGGGKDTLDFQSTTTRSVSVNLGVATVQTVNAGLKLILSSGTTVENVYGGSLGDVLTGNTLGNTLLGGDGNDSLVGGAGNDTYVFPTNSAQGSDTIDESGGGIDTLDFSQTTSRSVAVNLSSSGSQVVNTALTLTLGSGATLENVIGGLLGDTITGNLLANRLTGGGGSDSLRGGAGNDTYLFDADDILGSDTIIDSAGVDGLDFTATTTRTVAVDLALTTLQTIYAGGPSLTLTGVNSIENVTGGALGDVLRGNSLGNRLLGGDGNDILEGFGGNDALIGGKGNDVYRFDTDLTLGTDTLDESGGGEDTLNFGATSTRAVSITLASATSQVVNVGLTLLLGAKNTFENIVGGAMADALTGNSLNNRITGNAGNDVLTGGEGNDEYVFDTDNSLGSDVINESAGGIDTLDFSLTTTRNVAIDLANAAAQVVNAGLTLTLSATKTIENVIGGAGNDVLTGNAANNILVGGAGSDTLSGGDGRDVLIGGAGVDNLSGGSGDDLLIGGTTNFDANIDNLALIMSEWGRTDQSYVNRIAHLKTASGGKNGTILLKAGTVQNDAGAADQLTGGADLDWFFSSLNDNLVDFVLASETKTVI